jgi:hypothetical protein
MADDDFCACERCNFADYDYVCRACQRLVCSVCGTVYTDGEYCFECVPDFGASVEAQLEASEDFGLQEAA